jgi:hypothetical protein
MILVLIGKIIKHVIIKYQKESQEVYIKKMNDYIVFK